MKVVVIGLGRMGTNHARVLQQLGHHVETIDPDPAAGADWLEALPLPEADAACIATPIPLLAENAKLALASGMDVLVEKPGGTSMDDLLDLHALAERNGKRLFVGYTERWNPGVKRLADCLFLVGQVRHINVRRLGRAQDRGGDPALDLAVHDFDVLDRLGYKLDLSWSLGVPFDQKHVSLLLTDGQVTASLEASHLHPTKVRQIEVVGDDGLLLLEYASQTLAFVEADGTVGKLHVPQSEPLMLEWQAFASGSPSTGLAAMRLAEQIKVTEVVNEDSKQDRPIDVA